jgi:hypothetical protein
MLHMAVGPEGEGERQMLFDQLDLLQSGDALVLDRGYPATWLVQVLHQRDIDFIIRCDSTRGWSAVREMLRRGDKACWAYLPTSLDQSMASMAQLADLYHGRWRIEEARVCLKHRLGLESVSGLSQHALLLNVATKMLADNLAALLNRSVIAARAN